MSIIEGAQSHYRLFGPRGVLVIAQARLSSVPMEISVESKNVPHPMRLRMRTTDVSLFEEIILNAEYEFDVGRQPSVIVDAGANIGLTSVYFASRYPNAKIVAIEPEPSNFAMLVKNAARYPNIVPVKAALWKSDAMVDLNDPGSGNWGFQTWESTDGGGAANGTRVRGITVDTLMWEHGLAHIDIFKVDIEGSEKEVFDACGAWIDRIGVLIVEFHDRWKPGCSDTVRAAARDFPVEWTRGETTFFFRPEYCRPAPATTPGMRPPPARPRIVGVHR